MQDRRQIAEAIARKYIGSPSLLKPLGSGAEGLVLPTANATAVKIFTYKEKFQSELAAYERLRENRIDNILGFAVPQLINFDSELLVIEMTMVQPPFLLDFAQSVLDWPLDFPEGIDEWWDRVEADFGEHFDRARDVFFELQRLAGIYYYHLAPRNLNFGD